MIVGAAKSSVQVTVRDMVVELPQPSVAVKVLVCDLKHVPVIAPSACVIVGVLQPSAEVAEPSAETIADDAGLHPSATVL